MGVAGAKGLTKGLHIATVATARSQRHLCLGREPRNMGQPGVTASRPRATGAAQQHCTVQHCVLSG
eukprot:2341014-Lingulodinium_polyedra.AAC.1